MLEVSEDGLCVRRVTPLPEFRSMMVDRDTRSDGIRLCLESEESDVHDILDVKKPTLTMCLCGAMFFFCTLGLSCIPFCRARGKVRRKPCFPGGTTLLCHALLPNTAAVVDCSVEDLDFPPPLLVRRKCENLRPHPVLLPIEYPLLWMTHMPLPCSTGMCLPNSLPPRSSSPM